MLKIKLSPGAGGGSGTSIAAQNFRPPSESMTPADLAPAPTMGGAQASTDAQDVRTGKALEAFGKGVAGMGGSSKAPTLAKGPEAPNMAFGSFQPAESDIFGGYGDLFGKRKKKAAAETTSRIG